MGIASVVESTARGGGCRGTTRPARKTPPRPDRDLRWAKEKPIVSGFAAHDFASQSFSKVITVDFQHK